MVAWMEEVQWRRLDQLETQVSELCGKPNQRASSFAPQENMHETQGEQWTVRIVSRELQADCGARELPMVTLQPMSEVAVAERISESPPIAALEAFAVVWGMYSVGGLGRY